MLLFVIVLCIQHRRDFCIVGLFASLLLLFVLLLFWFWGLFFCFYNFPSDPPSPPPPHPSISFCSAATFLLLVSCLLGHFERPKTTISLMLLVLTLTVIHFVAENVKGNSFTNAKIYRRLIERWFSLTRLQIDWCWVARLKHSLHA